MNRAGPPPIAEAELIYRIAGDAALSRVSDGILALLGYPPAELMSGAISLAARIHADDQDIAAALFSPEPTDRPQVANLRLRQANGRIRCVKASYRKLPAADGDGMVLELLLQDAKGLARTMGEPAAMVNFRAMMENTDDFIYFKDRNHVFTGASQTLVALCHPAEHWTDLLGQTDYDVFPEPYADLYYRLEKQVFAGMPVAREIQEYLRKDGGRGWVDNRKYPIRDGQGEVIGLFGIARDITDKLRVEQDLRQERDALRNVLTTVNSIIIALDGQGRVTLINRAGWELLGYQEGELIGQDWFATCLPRRHDLQRLRRLYRKLLARNLRRAGYFEWRVRTRAGEERLIAWHNSTVRDEAGRVIGGLAAGEDISERRRTEAAIQTSEARFHQLFEHMSDGVAIYAAVDAGEDFVFVDYNRAGEQIGRNRRQDVIGRRLTTVFPGVAQMGLLEVLRRVWRGGEPAQYPLKHYQDGRIALWVENYVFRLPNGEVVAIYHDVTARKQDEDALRQAASVFQHAREGIMITAANGDILDVNQAFTRITGYGREEVLGKNPRLLNSGRQDAAFYASLWGDLNAKGYWFGEIWNRRKSGEVFAEMQTISTVRDEQGALRGYVSLFTDITPIKEQQRQLEHIAHYDALTGLPNRVLLADRLHQAMAQVQRHGTLLAVVYLDLDGFKAVNDAHGHEVGDKFLTLLAAGLKQALRDGDTLSRLGGDEFVAVLLDLQDREACVPVLNRLLAVAGEPITVGGFVLRVSASLGVTFFPQPEEVDADQLLRQADQAMYQAKQSGKCRFHLFDAEHDRSVRGHHESLGRIALALSQREFVLYYQPKVNMRTGQVIGAEALIRWQHPERGLLPPLVFLPVIEDHPLALQLGEWVLETALGQIEAWRDAGLDLPVSINVDALQLQQSDFVDRLRQRLARHPRIQPGDLELEVLETSALHDIAQVSAIIQACRDMGVGFALDDFGTGYSSLTYLKRLPANLLKIDQSFVRDMLDDPDDLAILEGVLGLSNAFQRQVIAEGVETPAHGEMLLRMGCELGQGYAIARPMPAAEVPGWLAGWRPDPAWSNCAAISRDDLLILYAAVEHRAWVAELGRYLRGIQSSPPMMGSYQCRLGRWLIEDATRRFADHPALASAASLHETLHLQAEQLVELKQQGRAELALSRLGEIETLRDALQEQVNRLIA